MKKELIVNEWLTPDMERTRNGATQLFRRKGLDRHFTSEENADVILKHDNKEMYAELIDGQWYWVSGCAECNGKPRDWMTYIECEEHNVCRTCGIHRNKTTNALGGKHGWQCSKCHTAEHEAEKKEALDAMPEEYDTWDFHGQDEITCPYCAHEFSDSFESNDADDDEKDCPRCDNVFKVTAVHSLTFDCDRLDD
jgi:hypothetical protein